MLETVLTTATALTLTAVTTTAMPTALNMPDHFTCLTDFWRCLWFWICQSSEYGTVVYARVTQSSEYVWMWLKIPRQCLNMTLYSLNSINIPENSWIFLNVPKNAWKCLNEPVLTMPQFSVCLIILDIWQGFDMPQALDIPLLYQTYYLLDLYIQDLCICTFVHPFYFLLTRVWT